jgi:ABC-type antimicrobial peptide transport system permease subunit
MIFSELMHIVWVNLMENKTKVILTSLGIIVGAATIVMVLAIGNGSQQAVAEQYKNINAGAITISYERATSTTSGGGGGGGGGFGGPPAGMSFGGGNSASGRTGSNGGSGAQGGFSFGGSSSNSSLSKMMEAAMNRMRNTERITLSQTDVDDLQTFVSGLDSAAVWATAKSDVTGGNLTSSTSYSIAGVTSDYQNISNLDVGLGSFITADDETNESKAAVIGYKLATEIFGDAIDAYDSVIYINNTPFTINGVLSEVGSVTSGVSPDESIFIPLSTAKKYVFSSQSYSPTVTVVASDISNVDNTISAIKSELSQTYPKASFTITDAGAQRVAATNSANTLSFLLIAVASIVFVVGGIGIMNVLFVSVRERTKEIGILKAIGSSKKDILMEFLMEAIVISLFGGVVGVIVSNLLMPLMTAMGQTVSPSVTGVVVAMIFAVATGTVFGFYPALKASSLAPIEALNEE